MDPQASADNPNPLFSVVIDSLGSATLNSAAAIARGLGISAAQVVHCLYRAPAILADRLDKNLAHKLNDVLSGIGYDVRVVADGEFSSTPAALFDISVYLRDADALPLAAQKLVQFIGLDEATAIRAIVTPPGLVLGGVSLATVDAFRRCVGETLEIIAAPQINATYTLVLGECHDLLRNRLLDDLKRAGINPLADVGVIATDIPSDQLTPLWSRHKTNAALRLVNSAFLRFDVTLNQPPPRALNHAERELFCEALDIPDEYLEDIFDATPVTLAESIVSEALATLTDRLSPLGLSLSATLTSFQTLQLRIESATHPLDCFAVLEQFALAAPKLTRQDPQKSLPYQLPEALPEIQARLVRAALEKVGAVVSFVESPSD